MINKENAIEIAKKKLAEYQKLTRHKLVFIDSLIRETDLVWSFFYTSEEAIKNPNLGVSGNPPLIISKIDGKIMPSATNNTTDYFIEQAEKIIRQELSD